MIQQSKPKKIGRPPARSSWGSILRGMSRVLEIFPATPSVRRPIGAGLAFVVPTRRPGMPGIALQGTLQAAEVDLAAVRSDWMTVGQDLRIALESHILEATTDGRE